MLERQQWPALIVCPKSIMEAVWVEQLESVGQFLIPILLEGSSIKVKKDIDTMLEYHSAIEISDLFWKNRICIINYEKVPLVIDALLKIKWKSIILDESTKIKSPTAKRSKAIMKLRDVVFYRSIMTGTLAPNGLQDAFNQYKFVNP